jgi:predicted phage terminase large subunit-like protein
MLDRVRAEIRKREEDRQRRQVQQDAERIRQRCKTLSGFVREAWHVIEPATDYIHGWHIDAICEHLEAITTGRFLKQGQPNRLLINVPPGTMKSLLVSVLWPAWEWGPCGKPQLRYLTTSYTEKYVKRDSRRMRDLVQSEWYRSLWPEVELVRAGEASFSNTKTGFREGMPFASLTSGRGDRVIIDDPHSTETAESPAERETTTRIFRESVPTRLNDPKTSAIVVIMQRLHEEDVSGQIERLQLGYVHLMLPMEFEPDRRCVTTLGFEDPRTYPGELLFPDRFPREVIERDKIPLGAYAIAGQFQQRPAPRKGALFDGDWLRPYVKRPERATLSIYGASDYAVTADGGDFTVHGVVGIDAEGRLWLLDLWRQQSSSDRWVEAFCDLVLEWKPAAWAEETGQIKAGVGPFLEKRMRDRRAYVVREQFPTRGDKAVRAQSIRGRMALDGLYVPVDAPWYEAFRSELLTFPTGRHDDQVDMLGLIGQLLDRMFKNPPATAEQPKQRDDYRSARDAATAGDWKTY